MIMTLQLCHNPVSAIQVSPLFPAKAEHWFLALALCDIGLPLPP